MTPHTDFVRPPYSARLFLLGWRIAGRLLLPFYLGAYIVHALCQTETRTARLARLSDLLARNAHATTNTKTLWVHAVSVGELVSGLTLIKHLQERVAKDPHWCLLVTTTTLSSARYAKRFLPQGVAHRFLPLDTPATAARFLRQEQIRLGILMESEIWPTLSYACKRRRIPLLVASTRLSPRSYRRAQRHPRFARALYGLPTLFLARHAQEVEKLKAIGARRVVVAGELKDAAPPPSVDSREFARFKDALQDAPCWAAISTHKDETRVILETHKRLVRQYGTVITLLCPRRPLDRTLAEILQHLKESGIPFTRRSLGEMPPQAGGIYLGDTFGEVGLWCSLAQAAFVGGSLVPHGGHNPREPAWFSCALFMGPHHHNQQRAVDAFCAAGALTLVDGADTLATGVGQVFAERTSGGERGAESAGGRAYTLVAAQGADALEKTIDALEPFLEAQGL